MYDKIMSNKDMQSDVESAVAHSVARSMVPSCDLIFQPFTKWECWMQMASRKRWTASMWCSSFSTIAASIERHVNGVEIKMEMACENVRLRTNAGQRSVH